MRQEHLFIDDYRLASIVLDILRQVLRAVRNGKRVDRDMLRELWYWVHAMPDDEDLRRLISALRGLLLQNGGLAIQARFVPQLEQLAERLATWVIRYAEGAQVTAMNGVEA